MDKLMEEVFREVKSEPNKEFTPRDLSLLQSPADIKMAMIYLYVNGYVSGKPKYSDKKHLKGEIDYMEWICFSP